MQPYLWSKLCLYYFCSHVPSFINRWSVKEVYALNLDLNMLNVLQSHRGFLHDSTFIVVMGLISLDCIKGNFATCTL